MGLVQRDNPTERGMVTAKQLRWLELGQQTQGLDNQWEAVQVYTEGFSVGGDYSCFRKIPLATVGWPGVGEKIGGRGGNVDDK